MDVEVTGWKSALPLLPMLVVLIGIGFAALTNSRAPQPGSSPPPAIALADDPGEPTGSTSSTSAPPVLTTAAPEPGNGPPTADNSEQLGSLELPLQRGQCFNGQPTIGNIELVECTEPHESEVYLTFDAADFRSQEWPDEPANFVGIRVCRDQLETLFPSRAANGDLFGWDSPADLDDVNGSDDQRVCWLSSGSVERTSGSLINESLTG